MGNPIDTLLDWPHTSDDQVLLNSALCTITVGDLRALRASLTRAEAERDRLGEAIHRAHAAAADRAIALARKAEETSSTIKRMQGATAAAIANDILEIANGLSRANGAQVQTGVKNDG